MIGAHANLRGATLENQALQILRGPGQGNLLGPHPFAKVWSDHQ
jgi:hypothetical protein